MRAFAPPFPTYGTLSEVGFYEFPCTASSDVSNRVGAGEERSGVGTLASPLVGARDAGLGDFSSPQGDLRGPHAR